MELIESSIIAPIRSGGDSPASNDFASLIDTPDGYAGQKGMLLQVNDTETGIDYVEDSAIPILRALENGNLPIKWNNMKQKISVTSNDVSINAITENAFTVGQSNSAGRRFFVPSIVDADTTPLPPDSVREGRMTMLTNHGGEPRQVILPAGHRFAWSGSLSTSELFVRPGRTIILIPAIYSKGEKVWTVIGSFSATHENLDFFGGLVRVAERSITNTFFSTSRNPTQANLVNAGFLQTGTAGTLNAPLPEIIPASALAITATQVRQGKEITVMTYGTGTVILTPAAGQKMTINSVDMTDTYTVAGMKTETFRAQIINNVPAWIRVRNVTLNGDPAGWTALNNKVTALENRKEYTNTDANIVAGLLNGVTSIHPKCISTPVNLTSNGGTITVTATQLAQARTVVIAGDSEASCILPRVVAANVDLVANDALRVGSELTIVNISPKKGMIGGTATTIIGNGDLVGSTAQELPANSVCKFLAVGNSTSFFWVFLSNTPLPRLT